MRRKCNVSGGSVEIIVKDERVSNTLNGGCRYTTSWTCFGAVSLVNSHVSCYNSEQLWLVHSLLKRKCLPQPIIFWLTLITSRYNYSILGCPSRLLKLQGVLRMQPTTFLARLQGIHFAKIKRTVHAANSLPGTIQSEKFILSKARDLPETGVCKGLLPDPIWTLQQLPFCLQEHLIS